MTLNLLCLAELSLVGETVRPIHKKRLRSIDSQKIQNSRLMLLGFQMLLIYPMEPVCSCFIILNSLHYYKHWLFFRNPYLCTFIYYWKLGTNFVVLAADTDSVFITYKKAHHHLELQFQGNLVPSPSLREYYSHMVHICACRQTCIHIK